ncbi:hypothetical protein [Haloarchaeobius sp. TZWSO28]|uniref:hypothetical protein n=1 Tax=Haloarchaeobius sp. TZWSO28 TaxID=3446119 RepID=UPI003EBDB86A
MPNEQAKRVPKSLGTETKLLGQYTLSDLAVGLVPAVVVVLGTQLLVPPGMTVGGFSVELLVLPVAAVAAVVGGVFVYLTPAHTSSLDWVFTMVGFQRRQKRLPHETAREYTQVQQIDPVSGFIERTDGTLVGLLRVDPPMLALATDEEWAAMANDFQDFLNTSVAFPIQLYATTQAFPVEEYLAHYEARLGDPDVQANPRLAALIENYAEWYAADLDARQMTIRDHYVVVPVGPDEVRFERESLSQQLTTIPVLGAFVRALSAPPIEEQRMAMHDALDDRLARLRAGIREMQGCNASRVSAADTVALLDSFWGGHTGTDRDVAKTLRTVPMVRGRQ